MDSVATKQQLVLGCRLLNEAGILDVHGHLSARTDDPGEMYINAFPSPSATTIRGYNTDDLSKAD
mgnify:CR=1 FL=1